MNTLSGEVLEHCKASSRYGESFCLVLHRSELHLDGSFKLLGYVGLLGCCPIYRTELGFVLY